jgi:hypothetical protein
MNYFSYSKYLPMKKIYSLFIATIFYVSIQAQPTLQWAKGMGGTGSERGNSIAVDVSGNVYTVGYFAGTVDFDPGVGIHNLTTSGANDIFISKLDATGNFVWAKSIGGTLNDEANSVAIDGVGNVYITGEFRSTVDFDPGVGVSNLTSASGSDVFIVKLDASGNFVWAKAVNASSGSRGNSIALDAFGNILCTGDFLGTGDFDPGIGTFNLTAPIGSADIFVLKLDVNGNFIWAKSMGGTTHEYGHSIAVDGSGNVYTTGRFQMTADFDPGVGVFNLVSNGDYDIFISKLDANGNFVWAKSMGSSIALDESGTEMKIDGNGNLLITGYFTGTVDFDPGIGSFNLISTGGHDIFILKLDLNGNFVWAKNIGGTGYEYGWSLAFDDLGDVYTTGRFQSTVDFDPGAGIFNLTSPSSDDIFISKLNSTGDFVWAVSLSGLGSNSGYGITLDVLGNIYTTGNFNGTIDVDPEAGIINMTANGLDDIFVHKMSPCSAGPSTPGTISGTTTICSGSSNTYSITTVAGATSYTWTLPGGWSGTSTTNTINTTASATSGDITVTANNACGSSTVQTLAITVDAIPATPGAISGTTTICSGSSNTYSITAVAGATSYTWTLPGGWSGTSTTNTINTTASATSGDVTVTANNACGNSTAATLAITVNDVPAMPSSITGNASFCEDATAQTYSVTNDVSATSYTWTLPIGWSGTSTTNSINSTAGASGGTITVSANNACGASAVQSLVVTINPLPVVSLALAVDTVCEKSEAFTLTGSSPSGGTFSGTGVSVSTFDPDAAGAGTHVITYTYTDGNSCTNSATDNMVVDLCLGISSESDITYHFSVYPNPTSSSVTIETKNSQEKNVVIYNSMGQIVFTQLMMTDKLMIDMSAFNSGIYLIQLQSENGFSSEIIVKQ